MKYLHTNNYIIKKNINLKFLNEILLYLLPVALISGSFFSDFFISLSGIIFIFYSIKEKSSFYYINSFSIIFFIWCIYIILVSLLSTDPLLSLESTLFYCRFGFFSLSIWFAINNNKFFIRNFTIILSIVFFILMLDAYIQFFTGKNSIGFQYELMRLSGFFADEWILGSYLSRILPLLFGLLTYQFSKSKKVLFFSMIILISTDIIIFLSVERLAFFNLLFSSFLIVFLVKKWKFIRLGTLVTSMILISFITFNYEPIKERMIDRTLDQIFITEEVMTVKEKKPNNLFYYFSKKVNIFSLQHQNHYETAIKIYFDNLIIGSGPKLFRKLCKKFEYTLWRDGKKLESCSTHPHNTYVQALSETGTIGFLFLFSVFLMISFLLTKQFYYIIFFKKSYLSDYRVCLLVALMLTFWPLIPSGNFYNNWMSIIYFLPVGFFLQNYYKDESINKNEKI